jgi:protein phosphatase
VEVKYFQIQGQRPYQEDSYYIDDDERFFLVCDGIGGSAHGDLASETVISSIEDEIKEKSKPFVTNNQLRAILEQSWNDLMKKADDKPETYNMGTTMVGAFFTDGGLWVANIGDSRFYHIRPTEGLQWRTKDHSLVQEMFDRGLFDSQQEMEEDARSNQITRAFVASRDRSAPKPDLQFVEDLQKGDICMLCSDGLIESFKGDSHVPILASTDMNLKEKKDKIEQECRENARDNTTAIFIQIE